METWMRNTSETDYLIKCNHVSADGHFDSLVTRVFCPGQTTPSAYLREKNKMYGSFVLHCFLYQRHLTDYVCTDLLLNLRSPRDYVRPPFVRANSLVC